MKQLFKSTILQSEDRYKRLSAIAMTILFIISMNVVSGQTKFKNDWNDMKLKGKIKSIKETDYGVKEEFLETFGEIQPSVVKSSRTYLFNTSGNVKEYISYYADGGINRKSIYKIDSLGYAVEFNCYNKKDELVDKTTYEYDRTLNVKEVKEYAASGVLKERIVRNYDSYGNCIESNIYNSDGRLVSKFTLKYDYEGDITERIEYNKKGREILKSTYRYDLGKNLVETTLSTPNGEVVGQIVYYYSFDFFGNWIQKITIRMDLSINTSYKSDEPRYITKREIEYF